MGTMVEFLVDLLHCLFHASKDSVKHTSVFDSSHSA